MWTWNELKLFWNIKDTKCFDCFSKGWKQQVFTVHEGQNITTSYECDATCWLKSQQLEPLHLKILAKSKSI